MLFHINKSVLERVSITVMLLCVGITAYTLSRFALLIQPLLSIQYGWEFELAIVLGQLAFQFPFLYRQHRSVYLLYYYNMLQVSLIGSLLLLPLILINHWYVCGYLINLSYFFAVVAFMFLEHKRRVKKLKLPVYLSYTWALYRMILLYFII